MILQGSLDKLIAGRFMVGEMLKGFVNWHEERMIGLGAVKYFDHIGEFVKSLDELLGMVAQLDELVDGQVWELTVGLVGGILELAEHVILEAIEGACGGGQLIGCGVNYGSDAVLDRLESLEPRVNERLLGIILSAMTAMVRVGGGIEAATQGYLNRRARKHSGQGAGRCQETNRSRLHVAFRFTARSEQSHESNFQVRNGRCDEIEMGWVLHMAVGRYV
jgi:hypothetical protein